MPKFLEDKLKAEYGNNPRAIYGTLNAIGAMHGNQETAKGRAMARAHADQAGLKSRVQSSLARRGAHMDTKGMQVPRPPAGGAQQASLAEALHRRGGSPKTKAKGALKDRVHEGMEKRGLLPPRRA